MRNKVDVRAFCIEQVVKMKFVDECNASKIVEEAKVLEEYVVGDAQLSEDGNEVSEMRNLFKDFMDKLNESRKDDSLRAWEIARSVPSEGVMGYGIKDCEA